MKRVIAVSTLLLLASIIIDSVLFELVILKGRLAIPHLLFNAIWAMISGGLILGHTVIVRSNLNSILFRIILLIEAIISLSINALMTYYLSPIVATRFAIDGVELTLLPLSVIILSMFSYLLGYTISKRYIIIKLLLWAIGILVSTFIALWLLGVPRTLPTENSITMIIWIVASAVAFACCVIGWIRNGYRESLSINDKQARKN